jgi:hypothetical protein
MVLPQTNFTIWGINTNASTAILAVQSGRTLTTINSSSGTALGGNGVTLTGTGLTGATAVTFGGVAVSLPHDLFKAAFINIFKPLYGDSGLK